MNPKTIPLRDTGFAEEILEGEIVLYGNTSHNACYLNEGAALVWQLIDGKRDVAEIGTLLEEAYPDAANVRADVEDALALLKSHGAVHLE